MNHVHINHQKGLATLLVCIILLVAATSITLYQSRQTIMDLKITSKELNHGIAKEIASAGVEQGIAYLMNNQTMIDNSTDNNGWMFNTPKWVVCNDVQIPCGDGKTQIYGNDTLVYRNVENINSTFDTPGVTLKVHYLTKNNNMSGQPAAYPIITVIGEATANGGKAVSLIKRSVKAKGILYTIPQAAMMVSGNANIAGTFNVWGDPDGFNGAPLSIWASGSVIPMSGNATTYDVTSPDGQYPNTSAMLSRNSVNAGDIVEDDSNFPTDLFFYTFGIEKANATSLMDKATVLSDCSSLNAASKGLFWITGNCLLNGANGDVGSQANPVIIIATDTTVVSGNLNLYGLLYIHDTAPKFSLLGTANIHGSLFIDIDFSLGMGAANFHYNETILNNANKTGGSISYMIGTWGSSL